MVTTTPPGDGGGEERCEHRAGEECQNPPRDCLSPLFSFSFVLPFFGDGWGGGRRGCLIMAAGHRMALRKITWRERDSGHLFKSLTATMIYSGRM